MVKTTVLKLLVRVMLSPRFPHSSCLSCHVLLCQEASIALRNHQRSLLEDRGSLPPSQSSEDLEQPTERESFSGGHTAPLTEQTDSMETERVRYVIVDRCLCKWMYGVRPSVCQGISLLNTTLRLQHQ